MRLFKGDHSDELVWEDDITLMDDGMVDWKENEKVYILKEDWQEWYLDDESADIETYSEVNAELIGVYRLWCEQNNLVWYEKEVFNKYEEERLQ